MGGIDRLMIETVHGYFTMFLDRSEHSSTDVGLQWQCPYWPPFSRQLMQEHKKTYSSDIEELSRHTIWQVGTDPCDSIAISIM